MRSYPNATDSLPAPGQVWGDYPQRGDAALRSGNMSWHARIGTSRAARSRRIARVRDHLAGWCALDDTALQAMRQDVQDAVRRHGLVGAHAEICCAFVAEAARRATRLDAFDAQLGAALLMLDGHLVEMAPGEGKSLAVAIAAAMAALAGVPVHVLTANDYLVERDARRFAPLFARLGLGVAWVLAADAEPARRAAYAQAIAYVSAQELAFDYLRDTLAPGAARPADASAQAPRTLRGLCMAIVDEADSLLIDAAGAPLALSRDAPGPTTRAYAWQAWALSRGLAPGIDFELSGSARLAELTAAGRAQIGALAAALQPAWPNLQQRERAIAAALTARHALQRERDYVVTPWPAGDAAARDARVRLVGAARAAAAAEDRSGPLGLEAFVALKEGCGADPTAERETIARITPQLLFQRYHRLGGTSGTLRESSAELARLYGLAVVPLAPRRSNRRRDGKTRVFASDRARREAVVQRAREFAGLGRPVLIGTDSVEESKRIADHLTRAGMVHALLSARGDADEACRVAEAGRCGRITVATHAAGRGTDIVPDREALRAGGLHVIGCPHNASARRDRQLLERAALQGQPGSGETWLALDAPGFTANAPGRAVGRVCAALCRRGEVRLPALLVRALHALLQRLDDRAAARARGRKLRADTTR